MPERKILSRRNFLILTSGFAGSFCRSNSEVKDKPFFQVQPLSPPLAPELLGPEEMELVRKLWSLKETELPVWKSSDHPSRVRIGPIGFESDVNLVETIKVRGDNSITYPIPDNGIATPKESVFPLLYVFGHSFWQSVPQKFGKIANLDRGNVIEVSNDEKLLFHFIVVDFKLNRNEPISSSTDLTLMLQTSAVNDGKWILNRENIIRKTGDEREVLTEHANLLVIAKPIRLRVLDSRSIR